MMLDHEVQALQFVSSITKRLHLIDKCNIQADVPIHITVYDSSLNTHLKIKTPEGRTLLVAFMNRRPEPNFIRGRVRIGFFSNFIDDIDIIDSITASMRTANGLGIHTQTYFGGMVLGDMNPDHPLIQFKVRDYTTLLVGRLDYAKKRAYVYRGDGTVLQSYSTDRISSMRNLVHIPCMGDNEDYTIECNPDYVSPNKVHNYGTFEPDTKVKRILIVKGWTLKDLAERWEISERQVARIVRIDTPRTLDMVNGLPNNNKPSMPTPS